MITLDTMTSSNPATATPIKNSQTPTIKNNRQTHTRQNNTPSKEGHKTNIKTSDNQTSTEHVDTTIARNRPTPAIINDHIHVVGASGPTTGNISGAPIKHLNDKTNRISNRKNRHGKNRTKSFRQIDLSKRVIREVNLVTNSPSSTLVTIQNRKMRMLVDSGAQVSILHKRIFDSLNNKPKLYDCSTNLTTASGDLLSVLGKGRIKLRIAKQFIEHEFVIVDNLNRNGILGRDFLVQNHARLYFDLSLLRVNNHYQALETDVHISSIVRSVYSVLVYPHTVQLITGRTRSTETGIYTIKQSDKGHLYERPGLSVVDCVGDKGKKGEIPILIANETGTHYRIRAGAKLGHIESAQVWNIKAERSPLKRKPLNFEELTVGGPYREAIQELIRKNRDVFAASNNELGYCRTLPVKIELKEGAKPIKQRSYNMPLKYKQTVDENIDKMLEAGIIQRTQSEWASPLVIIVKKDGTLRMCIDLRKVNGVIKHTTYPIPRIDHVLTLLNGARHFTSLDLFSGYHQQMLEPESRKILAFISHRGLFEFNSLPFGVSNGSGMFQNLLDIVLQGGEKYSLAYLDDILIYSKTAEEHLLHIQDIFDRLRQHDLKLKLKKCSFMKEETTYLGYVIGAQGIKPDVNKVKMIRNLPPPQTVREVRSFLGASNYYRKIIPNFSRIAEPLVELTKKHARFKWGDLQQRAFDRMKQDLTKVPLLKHPDPNREYQLYTDASQTTIGAVLCQRSDEADGTHMENPICFMSHKLSPTQQRYSTIEREFYALHYFVQKLDTYLNGASFRWFSDHRPLKYALSAPLTNKRLQLWSLNLASYNVKPEYIEGKLNAYADLLSRHPLADSNGDEAENTRLEEHPADEMIEVNVLNSNRFAPKDYMSYKAPTRDEPDRPKLDEFEEVDVQLEQEKDEKIVKIRNQLQSNKMDARVSKRFILVDHVVYFITSPDEDVRLRLYIPTHFRVDLLARFHHDLGHAGMDSTYDAISRKYYWPNLYKEIQEYNKACLICQERTKAGANRPPTELMEISPYPFATISIDLCGPFVESYSKNKYIFTIIDDFSRYPEAFPIPDKTAQTIVHILLDEFIPRYGCPLKIKSDNGGEFVNGHFADMTKALNIEHTLITPRTPHLNGSVERFNGTLNNMIAKQVSQDNRLWDVFINQTLSAIRVCTNESTGHSPFFLLFKREPVLPVDNILRPRRKYTGELLHQVTLEKMHREFMKVHSKMKRSQLRHQRNANKGAKPVEFKVGDPVFLRNFTKGNKLQSNWQPYYRVTKQTSPVSYIIRNQLDNTERKVQGRNLKLAHTDDWDIPKNAGKPIRRVTLAAPPDTSDDASDDESGSSSWDSEDNIPLAQIIRRKRREFSSSGSDEENMPLAALAQRVRARGDMNGPNANLKGRLPEKAEMVSDEQGQSDTETGRSSGSESATVEEAIAGREEIQNGLLAMEDPL